MTALPASSVGTAQLHAQDLIRIIPVIPRNLVLGFLTAYRKVISRCTEMSVRTIPAVPPTL